MYLIIQLSPQPQKSPFYGDYAYQTKSFVSSTLATKLRKAQKSDLIIATTSENIEDVCKTLVWLGEEEVCVSGETYIFKHNQNPKYLAYYLKTPSFFDFKKRNRTGTKVIRVHGDRLATFQIPIPCPDNPDRSLAIQAEIVRILDTFTELTAELSDRKKQYNYYRDRLLTFEECEVEWKTLGEIGEILRGTAITEKEANSGDYPVVANGPSHNYFHDQSNRSGETIVIARSGVYAGLVSYWDIPIFLTDAFSIHPDNNALSSKFLYYVLKKDQTKIHNMSKGAGVPHVRAKEFESYKVPVLPLEEQARIVGILDKFDTLTTSISEGLPREIALRQQQYEYYRDLLLSFSKAED